MMEEMEAKIGLVLSKDLAVSLRRYLPVARMKLSAMNGWACLLVDVPPQMGEVT
jgi:hypothetical protein